MERWKPARPEANSLRLLRSRPDRVGDSFVRTDFRGRYKAFGWKLRVGADRVLGPVFAERMCCVSAKNCQALGVEGQFFQGARDRDIFGMALDVGIKLCGVEGTAELVGFQLGHVHTIGGEAAGAT